MKKKIVLLVLLFVFALSVLSACGENKPEVLPAETTEPSLETTQAVSEEETEPAAKPVSETVSLTAAQTEATTASDVPSTVEEIVSYFNSSANRIKPTATKVVKNYEKRIVNEDKLVFPELLASAASSLIDTFMKDDTEPIVYDTREEITNEFLVPNQSYVSKLSPEWVNSATCTDKGGQYIINIKLKDEKNCVSGEGIGSVCDVIETTEVSEKAPFVEKFTTEYHDCEVTATVDKASGNVVHIKYIVSVELELTVDMFGKHDVAADLTFEKDYSITF